MNQSQQRGWLTKFAVLFIFLINSEISLVNTTLGEISLAFPETDPVVINLVSTMPVVFMFFATLLVGRLARQYDKKPILIIALIIYIVGGVGGFFMAGNIHLLLISRAIVGIGAGLSAPLTGAIIADLWEDQEAATMLGWSNALTSLLVVVITAFGAWLASFHWNWVFLAYAVFILVLLLEIFALPALPPLEHRAPGVVSSSERPHYTKKQRVKLGLIAIFVFANLMAGMMIFLKTPILITQEGLGGPVEVGLAMNTSTGAAFLSGLVFGWIYKFTRRYTLLVYMGFTALAFLTMMNAHSMPLILLAFLFNGLGMGMFMPSIQFKAIGTGPRVNASFAVSVALGAMFAGQFASSFVERVLALFGDPTPRTMFTFSFIMFCCFIVAYLAWVVFIPQDQPTDQADADKDEPEASRQHS